MLRLTHDSLTKVYLGVGFYYCSDKNLGFSFLFPMPKVADSIADIVASGSIDLYIAFTAAR